MVPFMSRMSALGQTQKSECATGKSALPSTTGIVSQTCQVRNVPRAEVFEISLLLYGSIKPLHAKSGLRHEVRDMNKVELRNETRLGNALKKLAQ
jgi:hypothetical protein